MNDDGEIKETELAEADFACNADTCEGTWEGGPSGVGEGTGFYYKLGQVQAALKKIDDEGVNGANCQKLLKRFHK